MVFLQTSSAAYQPKCKSQKLQLHSNSMKNHGICTILTHVIENVLPQPLSHNIAICMDQKHTKSTCSNQIYHFTVSYIQVLEKHKRAKSSNQSHNMITISHKPKHRYIFINKDSGQPRHEHHACHRNQYRQQGQPSPIPIGYFYWKSVKTNIRSYEIQHDKP